MLLEQQPELRVRWTVISDRRREGRDRIRQRPGDHQLVERQPVDFWAIVHGFLSWFYVLYYAVKYQ